MCNFLKNLCSQIEEIKKLIAEYDSEVPVAPEEFAQVSQFSP